MTPAARTAARGAPFRRLCAAYSARFGFPVAGEQAIAFMQGVTLLGPRSMEDIRQAALATLAPPPDRIAEFDALFRSFFYGEATVTVDAESDEDTEVKDDSGVEQEGEQPELRQEESGESASALEQLGRRDFPGRPRDACRASAGRCPRPCRSAARSARCARNSRGKLDLRRSLRAIVRADGDVPAPPLRRRPTVSRRLLILIDISGSMKLHTGDYLKLAHAPCRRADRAEVFTLGTRLTRITRALQHPRPRRGA